MRYVTIKDIAVALGLSKSTVSRALSGDSKNVSKETLQKIVETANEMGYRRNELGRQPTVEEYTHYRNYGS